MAYLPTHPPCPTSFGSVLLYLPGSCCNGGQGGEGEEDAREGHGCRGVVGQVLLQRRAAVDGDVEDEDEQRVATQ